MSDAHRDEIAKLENLYADNPEGRVFTHLAEAYRKAGDLGRAEEVLSDGIEQHPDYSSAHVVLGRVLMDQGRTEEADTAFRRVLELDPQNLIAIRSRGDLARDRGDDDAALDYYRRLLDHDPADDDVRAVVDQLVGTPAPSAQETPSAAPGSTGESTSGDRPASPAPSGEPVDDSEVRTETIAQVYARQGLYDRAAEVYRELVRARPDDHGLQERLAEMEELANAQMSNPDEVEAVADFDATEVGTDWAEESTEGSEEPDAEEFVLEGFESTELDTADVEDTTISGLETQEIDLESGLRDDAAPETASPAEDLSAELEVTDVPEPPEEDDLDLAADDDTSPPDWLAGIATGEEAGGEFGEQVGGEVGEDVGAPVGQEGAELETGRVEAEAEPVEADLEADEAVWAGTDWSDDVEAETTPYAWDGDEEETTPDTSPPVRHYLGDLLGWSQESVPAQEPAPSRETASSDEPMPSRASGPASSEPEATSAPGDSEDDDDLEMFRSWLESLKQ